jgi:hypothetical protein
MAKDGRVSKRTPSNVSQHSRSWEARRDRRSQGVSKRAVEETQDVNMEHDMAAAAIFTNV